MKSSTTLAALVAHCRKLARRRQTSDAELLRRYAGRRDAAAFEELVERYAPLVWSVCRRMLSNEADCEDAFQAAFLVLVRRASSIDPNLPLGAWLHTVAVHVADKARTRARRLPRRTIASEPATYGDLADEVGNRELFAIVDEEIARLPSLLQAPFVLCCLEGRTRDEAAVALGCSVAAIKSRLERGRNLLRQRLERRGFGLSAAFLVLGLTGGQVGASLRAKALQSALGCASAAVAALVPAAGASLMSKLTLTAMSLVMVGVLGFGAFLSLSDSVEERAPAALGGASDPPAAEARDAERPDVRSHAERGNEKDRFGDPLPPGAVRRFGTLRFRHQQIADLAFTPDGKRLIAGSGRHPLSVFDAVTGQRLREVGKDSPYSNVHGFALSADGKRVACCGGSDVFVWDLETGKSVRELGYGYCQSVAFSPDGKKIAAASEFGAEVVIMEIATGKHLSKWTIKEEQGRKFDFGSLAFSPDGKFLAGLLSERHEKKTGAHSWNVHFDSSRVYVLDAETGKLVRAFESADDSLHAFAFQPGTGQLAVAGRDDALRFWDIKTGKELHRLPARKGMSYVPRFTADGRRCLALNNAATKDGILAVLDSRDGRELRRFKIDMDLPVSVVALAPDGRAVAQTRYFTGTRVRVWDIESGAERLANSGHTWEPRLSLSADGRTLISKSTEVFHWDLRTGEGRPQPAAVEKETDRISWSWWAASARSRNWRLQIDNNKMEMEVRSLDGARLLRKIKALSRVLGFALSPDCTHVAIGFEDRRNTVFLWDPEKEEKPHELLGHPAPCHELLFSHDGKRLIASTFNPSPTVWIWDVATERVVHKLATNITANKMLLTADDRVLLTAGRYDDAAVLAWEMETGKQLARLADPSQIDGLALSADERFLAIVSGRNNKSTVSVWETNSWKLVRAFAPTQPSYSADSMVFSRDGQSLFVAKSDTTILEWDVSGRWVNGRRQSSDENLNKDRLNDLWRTLADSPDKAYSAVWEMLDHPVESVPFLIDKLAPVQPIDERRVRQLLEKLDSESFAAREQANQQLLALGEQTLPVLRQALQDKPTLETKKRVERVIESLISTLASDQLRLLRAIAVLEWSKRLEAVEHLRRIAGGAPAARLTRAAKAASRGYAEPRP